MKKKIFLLRMIISFLGLIVGGLMLINFSTGLMIGEIYLSIQIVSLGVYLFWVGLVLFLFRFFSEEEVPAWERALCVLGPINLLAIFLSSIGEMWGDEEKEGD